MSHGVCHRHGLGIMLLWLWCRMAVVAPSGPLAWKPPYATNVALKSKPKNIKSLFLCHLPPSSKPRWPVPKFLPFLHCILAPLDFGWSSHMPWSVLYHLFCPSSHKASLQMSAIFLFPPSERLLHHSCQEPVKSTASPFSYLCNQ